MRIHAPRVVGLVFFLTVVVPIGVLACSCAPPPEVATAFSQADAVFSGRVIGLELVPRFDEDPTVSFVIEDLRVKFAVTSCWKGKVTPETILHTTFTCCVCGYRFEIGESYIVYASVDDGTLRTSICTRTKPLLYAEEDLTVLGDLFPALWRTHETVNVLAP